MQFFKYHGAGNDFIVMDNRRSEIAEGKKKALAVKLCRRNFGIGADGLLLVEKPSQGSKADIKMRVFNPDGSEAEMCGNGIRCVANYAAKHIFKEKKKISIETLAGVKQVEVTGKEGATYVKVDFGEAEDVKLNQKLKVNGKEIVYCYLVVGVPHAVIFTDKLENTDVESIGRKIRFDRRFPKGANVDFVQKTGKNEFRIRTYERGVEKETLACGTGIVASGACAVLLGKAGERKEIKFRARGGEVFAVIKKDKNKVICEMIGPVELVFRGEIKL